MSVNVVPQRNKGKHTLLVNLIYLYKRNEFETKAKFLVSILDSDYNLFEAMKSQKDNWGTSKWTLRETLLKSKDLLRGGHLSLYCELTVYGT